MQDNPFADLIPSTPSQAPGVIYGRPKQPTPLELRREARADEDQSFQRAAQVRAQSAEDRANDAAARAAAAADRQAALDEKKLTQAGQLTEGQAKDTNFYNALIGAEQSWRGVANNPATADGAQGPGMLGDAARSVLPRNWINSLSTTERQQANQAKENFIRATLRLESGAAISDPEYYRQDQIFFPQTGDSPATIAQKAAARQQAINGFRIASGPGADKVDKLYGLTVNDRGEVNIGGVPATAAPQNRDAGGSVQLAGEGPQMSANAMRLSDEQFATFQKAAQEGASAERLAGIAAAFGHSPDAEGMKNLEGIVAFYAKPENRNTPLGIDYSRDEIKPVNPHDSRAVIRGAADAATLGFGDELSAVANTVANGGTYADNLDRARGMALYDQQNSGGQRIAGQIAGGFVLPTFGASSASDLARLGAIYGGAYGVGSADGSVGNRITGGALGAATGAAGGYGLARLGAAAASRLGGGGGGGGNPEGRALMEAAQRQGVDVLPADVGGPMTRRFTSGAVQTPFASGPVVRAADRMQTQVGDRVAQVAAGEGAPLRQEAFGELAQGAAQGYIDRTGAAARQAYGNARELAGNAPLRGANAVANIDQQLAELAPTANTDAGLIAGLQRLRSDLANEGDLSNLSIDAIRRLRTSTRAEAQTEGLRATDYNRRAGQVLDALSQDIASQLPPEAAQAFRKADAAYAHRLETIDDVMSHVIGSSGDRSAEGVANRLIQMGRGDSARLRSFLNAVNPEEAGIVRGSLINEMGRSLPGQQNAAGDAFSIQTFLSNWDRMPERTRGLLFRGESRDVMNDLAQIAEGARASRAYANTSGTAGALNATRTVSEIGRLGSTGAALSSFGGSIVLENLTGRLLASQRFAQWLARAPRTPAQRQAWVGRLSQIAAREPAVANDILPLQQALRQALPQVAAEDKPQDRRQ